MAKCDSLFKSGGCQGVHLGKFADCQAEALYELSMDEQGCGDGDFEGYATPVTVLKPEPVTLADGAVVEVQPGHYIVWTSTTGSVTIGQYYAPEVMAADYAVHQERYAAWDRGCDPSDLKRHADCVEFEQCQIQCEGHESLDGPIGHVIYCDGACKRP
jgi:hypothetical protein